MRVIAGQLGGRTFEAPRTNRTHPMSERMRGALFNALGDISGLSLLDCFGGSGALSIEAISRGAKSSVLVEVDKTAYQTIIHNIDSLGVQKQIKATRANVSSWSDNNSSVLFDLVMCNPPFDSLKSELIEKLTRHANTGGLFILCWPSQIETPKFAGLDLADVKEKDYGDAMLVFYRKTG